LINQSVNGLTNWLIGVHSHIQRQTDRKKRSLNLHQFTKFALPEIKIWIRGLRLMKQSSLNNLSVEQLHV